jgi:dCMP deaminase
MECKKWERRYMQLARQVAGWSKDPSSQIGAVAIAKKGQVLSQGYNGFPRGIADDDNRISDRATKYRYVVHAEMNAIYNATYNGVSLDGSTLYVSGLPCCSECAKGIIQVGISRVVMDGDPENPRWKESCSLALDMFKEAGVEVDFIPKEL